MRICSSLASSIASLVVVLSLASGCQTLRLTATSAGSVGVESTEPLYVTSITGPEQNRTSPPQRATVRDAFIWHQGKPPFLTSTFYPSLSAAMKGVNLLPASTAKGDAPVRVFRIVVTSEDFIDTNSLSQSCAVIGGFAGILPLLCYPALLPVYQDETVTVQFEAYDIRPADLAGRRRVDLGIDVDAYDFTDLKPVFTRTDELKTHLEVGAVARWSRTATPEDYAAAAGKELAGLLTRFASEARAAVPPN